MPYARQMIVLSWLSLVCVTGPLSAQELSPVDWQPVDQTVADLDLRSASSRRVEPGIGVYGQSGSLYRRSNAGPGWMTQGQALSQEYVIREPGVTAYIDQPDYLVVDQQGDLNMNVTPSSDQSFLKLIPSNTVFDLTYRPEVPVPYYEDTWFEEGAGHTYTSTRYEGIYHGEVTDKPRTRELAPMPVAHRLPPHLIRERELRAAEARLAAEQAEDDPLEVLDDVAEGTPEP